MFRRTRTLLHPYNHHLPRFAHPHHHHHRDDYYDDDGDGVDDDDDGSHIHLHIESPPTWHFKNTQPFRNSGLKPFEKKH